MDSMRGVSSGAGDSRSSSMGEVSRVSEQEQDRGVVRVLSEEEVTGTIGRLSERGGICGLVAELLCCGLCCTRSGRTSCGNICTSLTMNTAIVAALVSAIALALMGFGILEGSPTFYACGGLVFFLALTTIISLKKSMNAADRLELNRQQAQNNATQAQNNVEHRQNNKIQAATTEAMKQQVDHLQGVVGDLNNFLHTHGLQMDQRLERLDTAVASNEEITEHLAKLLDNLLSNIQAMGGFTDQLQLQLNEHRELVSGQEDQLQRFQEENVELERLNKESRRLLSESKERGDIEQKQIDRLAEITKEKVELQKKDAEIQKGNRELLKSNQALQRKQTSILTNMAKEADRHAAELQDKINQLDQLTRVCKTARKGGMHFLAGWFIESLKTEVYEEMLKSLCEKYPAVFKELEKEKKQIRTQTLNKRRDVLKEIRGVQKNIDSRQQSSGDHRSRASTSGVAGRAGASSSGGGVVRFKG